MARPDPLQRAGAPCFREEGRDEEDVRAELARLCRADHSYAGGSIFNSICSAPLPLSAAVFAERIAANMGDNRVFPSLREIEGRITAMLGELLGHPSASGALVSGGTEANLLAVSAALRARGRGPGRPQILLPQSAHFSFDKIAALLDVELCHAATDGQHRLVVEDLRRRICARTALIVVTAGTSECGAVDDVPAAAQIAQAAGLPLHVDAATGGFLIPFARELGYALPASDFTVPGVTSVTVDPHKYGYAPVPAGYLLFRDPGPMDALRCASHYHGTAPHVALLGTRPGASAAAVYAALAHLGRGGYRRAVGDLFAMRGRLLARLRQRGYALAYEPDLTVIGIRLPDPIAALRALESAGLIASVSRRWRFLRLVLHRHLCDRDLERLLDALDDHRAREDLICA